MTRSEGGTFMAVLGYSEKREGGRVRPKEDRISRR